MTMPKRVTAERANVGVKKYLNGNSAQEKIIGNINYASWYS